MRTGFVGAGKMAEALLGGMLREGVCSPEALLVSDLQVARCDEMKARYGVASVPDNIALVQACDVVVLAVKPQDLVSVLDSVLTAAAGKLFVSIAAGKRLVFLESRLPGARWVRVMPNLPCQVGKGMSVFAGGTGATAQDLAFVRQLLESCGRAVALDEALFDEVTALSGSGPAFFAYVAKAMAEAAATRGVPAETALLLALQTMAGTAAVLMDTGLAPGPFMDNVASKGGTTEAGLEVLRESRLPQILEATLTAAAERSMAMSGSEAARSSEP